MADAEAGLEGDAVDPEFGDEGDAVVCVGLPCVPVFDCEVVGAFADLSVAGGLLASLFIAGGGAPVVEVGAPPAEGPAPAGTDCALPITVLKINAEITRAVFETALNMTFTF
jgi:hypothetical protein